MMDAAGEGNKEREDRPDGSAREGTSDGGAGALIQLHFLNRDVVVRAMAGAKCSSLRAELMGANELMS